MFDKEEMTGTTIMAVKFKDGIVIGADTRTSMGSFVANKTAEKLTRLTDYAWCCRSGSAADTQMIARFVKKEIDKLEAMDENIISIKRIANLASKIIYYNPSLLAGLIVAGYDNTGPKVYSINLGGALIEDNWVIGGSGSAFIYGYCDTNFKEGMNMRECLNFVRDSIKCAIKRDNSSGGCVRMAVLTREGIQKFFVPVN